MTEDRSGYFTPTPADRIQVVDLDETKLLVHVGLDNKAMIYSQHRSLTPGVLRHIANILEQELSK